jgi:hypothetical protein
VILIVDLDAMPRYTIQVSAATCASTTAQSTETLSATVELSMASTLTGRVNTSAHSKIVNMVSGGNKEAFKDDWITPNDMSRYTAQNKMRQYYKEIKL